MEDGNGVTERLLNLTLEIVYLLTGENYIVFKLSECLVASNLRKVLNPMIEPPSLSLGKNKTMEEVTSQIIELLTRKVPISCQDVSVCVPVEECSEPYRTRYNNAMMENQPSFPSPDPFHARNSPERYASTLHSQNATEEDPGITADYQDENLAKVEVKEEEEVIYMWADKPCKKHAIRPQISTETRVTWAEFTVEEEGVGHVKEEVISADISADGHKRNESHGHLITSPDEEAEDDDITSEPLEENPIGPNLCTAHPSENLSCDISTYGNHFPDHSHSVTTTAHRGGDMFPCSECGEYFLQKVDLISHQKTHKGNNTYSCEECGKCFPVRSKLTRHYRTHTGEKPFPCPVCGKCFSQRGSLISHMKIHTGEKPYSCSECGKSFTQRIHLTSHQMTHTGEKPFSCLECGRCFTHRRSLILHQAIHAKNKHYLCLECGKYFSDQSSLARHQVAHTGIKLHS
ncbi:gastrula zinc finger protein XlCGF53.1-like [Hyperolius riggenbachi]|uniref:gastrula zinc finger protein XlCGF53.1-like n=1 Tax=Hyperolius riggenbachi TaxID=752182 RepID=UPI0035A29621